MKAFVVLFSLVCCLTVANAQVLTAAAIVIGAKILIAKGFVYGAAKGTIARNIGGNIRHRRQDGDFNNVLTEENKKDADDCAKLLVCHLNARPVDDLDVSFFLYLTGLEGRLRVADLDWGGVWPQLQIEI